MTLHREFSYTWATWLLRRLTRDNSCECAVWFMTHHHGCVRQPSDFDQTQW